MITTFKEDTQPTKVHDLYTFERNNIESALEIILQLINEELIIMMRSRDIIEDVFQDLYNNIISHIEKLSQMDLKRYSKSNIIEVMFLLNNIIDCYTQAEKIAEISNSVCIIAKNVFVSLRTKDMTLASCYDNIIIKLLELKDFIDKKLYSDTIISVLAISEPGLEFKLTEKIILLLFDYFKTDTMYFLYMQASICVYHNSLLTECSANVIYDITNDYFNGESNNIVLEYISKIIQKNCFITAELNIVYFQRLIDYILQTEDTMLIKILYCLIKHKFNLRIIYNTNYNVAKGYDDIVDYVAGALPVHIYEKLFPIIDNDKDFSSLCLILKFQIIKNPSLFGDPDVSMFIWDYFLSTMSDRTSKDKERIIEVLSCLLDEECYLDLRYIVINLDLFQTISTFIECCNNVFYSLDIIMYFAYRLIDIEDDKAIIIEILNNCRILEIMRELFDLYEGEWIEVYINSVMEIINNYLL